MTLGWRHRYHSELWQTCEYWTCRTRLTGDSGILMLVVGGLRVEGTLGFGVENAGKKRETEALRNSKGRRKAEERRCAAAAEEARVNYLSALRRRRRPNSTRLFHGSCL